MKKRLSALDCEVVRAYARAAEFSALRYKLDVASFCKAALGTEIFKNFPEDYTVFGQSGSAIAGKILDEIEGKGITVDRNYGDNDNIRLDAENGYWMGYVLMYWYMLFPEDLEIEKRTDMYNLFDCYDALHTADVLYAIDYLKDRAVLE